MGRQAQIRLRDFDGLARSPRWYRSWSMASQKRALLLGAIADRKEPTTMRGYAKTIRDSACVVTLAALLTACAVETSSPRPAPRAETPAQRTSQAKLDPAQAERL